MHLATHFIAFYDITDILSFSIHAHALSSAKFIFTAHMTNLFRNFI